MFQDIAKNVYILEIDYENVSKPRYRSENMVFRNYPLLSILLIEQLYNYRSGKGLTKIYDSDMCCHLNFDPERVLLTILSKRELT